MLIRALVATLLLVLGSAVSTNAATLYVCDTGGDDSRTKTTAQTQGTPWDTIGRAVWGNASRSSPNAAQAASAGDIVIVCAGTYSASTTARTRFDVWYNPTNDGSLGNPITIQTDGGTVILTTSAGSGPIIGCEGKDYITWEGFTIDEANAPYTATGDSGVVVFHDSTGCRLTASTIIGDDVNDGGGNHSAVRIEFTHDIRIDNNEMSGGSNNGSQGDNDALILTYDVDATIIEHNELHSAGGAIFIKGDHDGDGIASQDTIIRYNYIHDMGTIDEGYGIMMLASIDGRIYQNIIANIPNGFCALIYSLGGGPSGDQWVNNTFYNCDTGMTTRGSSQGYSGIVFYNNIMQDMRINWGSFQFDSLGDIDSEHNVYFSNSGNFGDFGVTSYATITNWRSGTSQDDVTPDAITTDPLFVTAGSDFHLQGGSPALALGVDILDLDEDTSTTDNVPAGAYVTGLETIGPGDNGDPPGGGGDGARGKGRMRMRGKEAPAANFLLFH